MDRLDEVDVIHGRGNDVGARVAIGGDGPSEVDEVHEAAAEEIAQGVGVVGEDDLSHLGLRACYGTHKRIGFSRAHYLTCSIFPLQGLQREFTSSYNEMSEPLRRSTSSSFGNPRHLRKSPWCRNPPL